MIDFHWQTRYLTDEVSGVTRGYLPRRTQRFFTGEDSFDVREFSLTGQANESPGSDATDYLRFCPAQQGRLPLQPTVPEDAQSGQEDIILPREAEPFVPAIVAHPLQ